MVETINSALLLGDPLRLPLGTIVTIRREPPVSPPLWHPDRKYEIAYYGMGGKFMILKDQEYGSKMSLVTKHWLKEFMVVDVPWYCPPLDQMKRIEHIEG